MVEAQPGRRAPGCGGSGAGGSGRLANKADEVEGVGQDISHEVGFGTIVESEPWRTFELTSSLVGVAALGITLSADAKLPGGGIELEVSGEAQAAVGQCQPGAEGVAQGMVRVTEGTVVSVRQMAMGQDIGMWLTATALATDPRSGLTVIVMTIRSEGVAAGAEGDALGIIATGQTDDRVLIDLVMAQREDAQCAQIIC